MNETVKIKFLNGLPFIHHTSRKVQAKVSRIIKNLVAICADFPPSSCIYFLQQNILYRVFIRALVKTNPHFVLIADSFRVNLFGSQLTPIPTDAEVPVEICHHAACNGDAHSKYIDENEEFVLHETTKGDEKVVFYHAANIK